MLENAGKHLMILPMVSSYIISMYRGKILLLRISGPGSIWYWTWHKGSRVIWGIPPPCDALCLIYYYLSCTLQHLLLERMESQRLPLLQNKRWNQSVHSSLRPRSHAALGKALPSVAMKRFLGLPLTVLGC